LNLEKIFKSVIKYTSTHLISQTIDTHTCGCLSFTNYMTAMQSSRRD